MARNSIFLSLSGSLSALAALLLPGPGIAAAPPDGRAVMEEVDRRQRSDSMYADGVLTVERRAKISTKAWRTRRWGWGADVKTLLQFFEPPEVRGVSLLTLRRRGRPDEQWLYAPAIDRDRRIAPQEKSTRFLGTDFTYEDMQERDLESFAYRLLGEDEVDGAACYRIEARPHSDKESHYSRLRFWVRQDLYVIVRIEGLVDEKLRREFRASELRTVNDIVTAHRWEVLDLERDSRTVLELANVRYGLPLDAGLFTIQGMHALHPRPGG